MFYIRKKLDIWLSHSTQYSSLLYKSTQNHWAASNAWWTVLTWILGLTQETRNALIEFKPPPTPYVCYPKAIPLQKVS